jgi:hypothetical protein
MNTHATPSVSVTTKESLKPRLTPSRIDSLSQERE